MCGIAQLSYLLKPFIHQNPQTQPTTRLKLQPHPHHRHHDIPDGHTRIPTNTPPAKPRIREPLHPMRQHPARQIIHPGMMQHLAMPSQRGVPERQRRVAVGAVVAEVEEGDHNGGLEGQGQYVGAVGLLLAELGGGGGRSKKG
jgi:hypothetical protein